MKKYGLIVAGGSGQRMNSDIPKQFLLIGGKSILQYTLQVFADAFGDMEMIIVLPHIHIAKGEQIIGLMKLANSYQIVSGGDSRFQSVKNGLGCVTQTSIVFVHDAVRCLVRKQLIWRCYEQALEKGSAIPAVAATDSVRLQNGGNHQPVDRSNVRIIQTPQTFQSHILLSAFEQEYQPSFTDEATVAEASGQPVFLIEGEYDNFKITRPIDLLIAEKLMEESIIS